MTLNVQAKARDSPLVKGTVLDAAGNGVADATVFLRGETMIYRLVTQSNGQWAAAELPGGAYQLYAVGSHNDTWTTPRQVTITGQEDILLTLAAPDNAVVAGDFEGDKVWQSWARTNNPTTLSNNAFSGQQAAHLGETTGQAVSCSQNNRPGQLWSLQQEVTIPTSESPKLSFVAQIATNQTAFDYAWLEVVVLVKGQPHYLIPWGQLWQPMSWTLQVLDMAAWRGQTVTLLFQAVNCSQSSFIVDIDRVSLGTQVPNPNFTPTLTPTPGDSPDQTPTPIHTPTNPNATYLAAVRQLTACENQGNHHLFIYVLDAQGKGIPDVRLRVSWGGGEVIIQTGTKMENPGLVDFPMFKGSYWVEVLGATSDKVGPLTPDIPQDVACEETDNPVGNSLYHYSYRVTFTKQ